MNRRDFFKASLAGAAISYVEPTWGFDSPQDTLYPTGAESIYHVCAAGNEWTHRATTAAIKRGGYDIVRLGLSAYGGIVTFQPMPTEEIIVLPSHPVTVHGDFDGDIVLMTRRLNRPGTAYAHLFKCKRDKKPTYSRIPLERPSRFQLPHHSFIFPG